MQLAPKTNTKFAVLAAVETEYGTAVALDPAQHGLRVTQFLGVQRKYDYDGKRPGKAPGTAGLLGLVGPEGRHAEFTMHQEGGGPGDSAVPVPHLMLLANQFTTTDSRIYTPADEPDYNAITVASYEGGELYTVCGCIGDGLEFGGDLGHIPVWTSKMQGLMPTEPVDAAFPANVVYNHTPGAKAVQMQITLGDFVPRRVQNFKFSQKLGTGPRAFDNLNGIHGGFHPGEERHFELEFLMEAVGIEANAPYFTATTFNAGVLKDLAQSFAISFMVGKTANKRYVVTAPNAQIMDDPREKKGAVRMWHMKMGLYPSSEIANDEVQIEFPATDAA